MVKAGYGRSSGGGVKSSKQATRYAANRKGEEQNQGGREIYDKDGAISKDDAYRKIEAADQGGDKYHYRLTLSHVQTGEGVDHHATTRETMQRLEERHAAQGGEVTWHAVNHTDHTNHEHTHVVAVTDRRIGTADFANMRAEMDRSYERHTPRDVERMERDRPQEPHREVQVQAAPDPQREEAQVIPEPQRQEAEPAQEDQHQGGGQGGPSQPSAEQTGQKKPRQQIELEWIQTDQQRREEAFMVGKPSLINSNESSREFTRYSQQYTQLETQLEPPDCQALHMREMEWAREQHAAGRTFQLNEAYFQDNTAALDDMQRSRDMPAADRQIYMESRADDRWRDRAVNDRKLSGDDLAQASTERRNAREYERYECGPQPEQAQRQDARQGSAEKIHVQGQPRQTRWGENRRQHNADQDQGQQRQGQAWTERPPRNQRQQQRQERQQDRHRGGHER